MDKDGNFTNEVLLNDNINIAGANNTQPYPGKDLISGMEVRYFVSDRKGGKGGKDIWYSPIDGNSFGPAVNLASVNREGDEITPFYNTANNNLYFSTDGREGFGGLEIFMTDGIMKVPSLLPAPFNTSMNDMYFFMDDTGGHGYLTSNRAGSSYQYESYEACCMDIYSIDINVEPILEVETMVQGENIPLNGTTVCLIDGETGREISCVTNDENENNEKQCDFDPIGTLSPAADIETVLVINDLFSALKFDNFTIRLNNRLLLNGLLEKLGLAERSVPVLRALDKLGKIGPEKVPEEMAATADATPAQAADVLKLAGLEGTNDAVLSEVSKLGAGSPRGEEGAQKLRDLLAAAAAAGVPERRLKLDVSIALGLDYYTGVIYETFLNDLPKIGSVCSGGRYDNLAGLYTKQELPGRQPKWGESSGQCAHHRQNKSPGIRGFGGIFSKDTLDQRPKPEKQPSKSAKRLRKSRPKWRKR